MSMSADYQDNRRKSIWESNSAMPAVKEISTTSMHGPQIYRSYSGDNRQLQSYRQPWSPDAYQPNDNKSMKQSVCGPDKKCYILAGGIAMVLGIVFCAIPVAVMTTLYLHQQSSSSSNDATNTGSSGSSSGSSVTLPSQCSSYTTRAEADRNIAYTGCTSCYCDSSLSTGWYRFTGAAGTRLVTMPVSTYSCGATYTGWFNGSLPSTIGTTTTGAVCVNSGGNLCYSTYSISVVLVTNCSDFYVFYLTPMNYCYTRYCTT